MKILFLMFRDSKIYEFSFFIIMFCLFVYWFIDRVDKDYEIERKRLKSYWTKERLAEYERARKESEKKGIPY